MDVEISTLVLWPAGFALCDNRRNKRCVSLEEEPMEAASRNCLAYWRCRGCSSVGGRTISRDRSAEAYDNPGMSAIDQGVFRPTTADCHRSTLCVVECASDQTAYAALVRVLLSSLPRLVCEMGVDSPRSIYGSLLDLCRPNYGSTHDLYFLLRTCQSGALPLAHQTVTFVHLGASRLQIVSTSVLVTDHVAMIWCIGALVMNSVALEPLVWASMTDSLAIAQCCLPVWDFRSLIDTHALFYCNQVISWHAKLSHQTCVERICWVE